MHTNSLAGVFMSRCIRYLCTILYIFAFSIYIEFILKEYIYFRQVLALGEKGYRQAHKAHHSLTLNHVSHRGLRSIMLEKK